MLLDLLRNVSVEADACREEEVMFVDTAQIDLFCSTMNENVTRAFDIERDTYFACPVIDSANRKNAQGLQGSGTRFTLLHPTEQAGNPTEPGTTSRWIGNASHDMGIPAQVCS